MAKALKQPSWRKMYAGLTREEIVEWMAFERIEPWGNEFARTSTATARLINIIKEEVDKFASRSALRPRDFVKDDFLVPKYIRRTPKKNNREAVLENLAAMEPI